MIVASYGAGTNSTAMLVGVALLHPALRPDAILFADTGGERPETYRFIAKFTRWLQQHEMPPITVVRKGGRQETLEQMCLRLNVLPSVAYGWKTCSHKFKIAPQQQWCNNSPLCRAEWDTGKSVTLLIGMGIDEEHRATPSKEPKKYTNRFPLIEWGWDRDACVKAIVGAGLPLPGKSACFFCPNSKKDEIRALPKDLQDRAIAMERNATKNTTVKGLGRRWSWESLLSLPVVGQCSREPDDDEMPCGCFDG